jgi:GntR family transcriptional regulator/MocR family aminotransferase
MLLLRIDREGDVPAYRQVCDQIVKLVDEGALQVGDRLPPTRVLGASVGLHRSSIVRAYGELRALGYLDSRSGSYTTIRRRQRPLAKHSGREKRKIDSLIDWAAVTRPSIRTLNSGDSVTTLSRPDVIDFDRLCADPSLAPDDELKRCVRTELHRTGGNALDYSDASGWLPLREVIAAQMSKHGYMAPVEEILITSGAQQALDLVMRYLTSKGDRIVVEAPTYGMFHSLIKLHELKPVEVPLLHDGMDLDGLEWTLGKGRRPKFVFTMPNFHNPTGITSSQQHRENLLELCEKYQVPLVEDGFEEEMKYFGQAVMPIKSMDSRGIVLYVGTFSKVVFPGLRIGWICAHRDAIARLRDVKTATSISGNTLAQAVAARYCNTGGYAAYLRRIHRIYRRRMQALLRGLLRHMPDYVQWTRPSGGYTTWLTLQDCPVTEDDLLDKLNRAGVKVGSGRRYFADPPSSIHFRLSIACADDNEIETGCRLIGQVLGNMAHG